MLKERVRTDIPLCMLKAEGGLGIRKLEVLNKVLTIRHI